MAVNDPYVGMGGDLLSPSSYAFAAPISDTAQFQNACKRLWIGTGGTVRLQTTGGSIVTYTAPSGTYLNVRAVQIFATGTTASNITAEY